MNDDKWYMGLASSVSRRSKDPSTKVGAIIVSPSGRIVSTGYNGFPRRINDDYTCHRNIKYIKTLHAELNAILYAREKLDGFSIYVTTQPCATCCAAIIQVGITKVCYIQPDSSLASRWDTSFRIGLDMLVEANVNIKTLER